MKGKRITTFRVDLSYEELKMIVVALCNHGYGEDYNLADKFNDLMESDSE